LNPQVSGDRIRLLVVDDHAVVREGLRMFLVPEMGFEVVGEAADGRVAVELARALRPDLVLMDLLLPGLGGVGATAAIRAELPGVQVMVLTSVLDETVIRQAIEAGAAGYLLKETSDEDLRVALRAVAAGQVQLAPQAVRRLLGSRRPGPEGLSERELEVLEGMAGGKANKEIARDLGLSPETVKTYVKRVLHKLGVRSRTEAAVQALARGLLQRP
jgi:two-component system, NarL family, response regulator LiaR